MVHFGNTLNHTLAPERRSDSRETVKILTKHLGDLLALPCENRCTHRQPLLKTLHLYHLACLPRMPSHLNIKPPLGARACTQAVTHSTIGWLDRYLRPSGFAHARVCSADHSDRQPWNTDAIAPGSNPKGKFRTPFRDIGR